MSDTDLSQTRVTLLRLAADGRFADVWEAKDQLGRKVAVKIIRPSMGYTGFTLAQAQALARVRHANVVTVYSVEPVVLPNTTTRVEGIVMEWLEGHTLKEVMRPPLLVDKAKRIGLGIVDGLEAVHAAGLAHCDLHAENVIIGSDFVKVLDLLHTTTLAAMPTASRDAQVQRDCRDVHAILRDLLRASSVAGESAAEFGRRVGWDDGLAVARRVFEELISLQDFPSSASPVPGGPRSIELPDVGDRVKELVASPQGRVPLDALITQETLKIRDRASGDEFRLDDATINGETVLKRLEVYKAMALPLAGMILTGTRFGGEEHAHIWQNAAKRLAYFPHWPNSHWPVWAKLRFYPCSLIVHAAMLGVVASNRYRIVQDLVSLEAVEGQAENPLFVSIHAQRCLPNSALNLVLKMLGKQQLNLPGSTRIRQDLVELRPLLGMDETEFAECLDQTELLVSMLAIDSMHIQTLAPQHTPLGIFIFRSVNSSMRDPIQRAKRELQTKGQTCPLVHAGLFDSDPKRALRCIEMIEAAQQYFW